MQSYVTFLAFKMGIKHFLLLYLFDTKKVFLGVASNLTTCSSSNVLFNEAPIFTVKLKTLDKSLMFGFSPPSVLLRIWALVNVRACSLRLRKNFSALVIVLLRKILNFTLCWCRISVAHRHVQSVWLWTFEIGWGACRFPGDCAPQGRVVFFARFYVALFAAIRSCKLRRNWDFLMGLGDIVSRRGILKHILVNLRSIYLFYFGFLKV